MKAVLALPLMLCACREQGPPAPTAEQNQQLNGITTGDYVYFVHGFAAPTSGATVAITDYSTAFTAVARHENFCGTQFHPERSGVVGARILANFLKEPT